VGSIPAARAILCDFLRMNIRICKYCSEKFCIDDKPSGWMGNHTRWCLSNPKRDEYINSDNLAKARAAKKIFHNQYTKAIADGREVPVSPSKGKSRQGFPHTEETKKRLSEKARLSKRRRLRKGTIVYQGVLLDSKWELELAKRLDDLHIDWIRPDPIEWIDEKGLVRNYFPDFYLPDYDLYLDPKNPYACEVQKDKIDALLTQVQNLVIIKTLKECKTYMPT